ncbi:MAG: hypothetical protein IT305_14595 [Chloroflexi bacterium]|nr:hypothetical protein [Chloroflexota bacterium]
MLQRTTRLFGMGRYFWDAIREINPADVRADLERPVAIDLFGREGSGRHTLAHALFGTSVAERPGRGISIAGTDVGAVAAAGPTDLALIVLDATEPDWTTERRIAQEIASRGYPGFLVLTHADLLPSPEQGPHALRAQFPAHPPELMAVVDPRDVMQTRQRLLGPILKTIPQERLALAHQYPAIRHAIVEDLIFETSRVNAQFALVSSLPAVIPLLGFFVGGVADMLVLTKNQAMLVFKLAGIYGRNIDDRFSVLREILPVIGGAFVWRTLARTAVEAVAAPGGPTAVLAALPKATVAFAGTYAVGEAARYYYERGEKPPPEAIAAFRDEALRLYSTINDQLKARLAKARARSA